MSVIRVNLTYIVDLPKRHNILRIIFLVVEPRSLSSTECPMHKEILHQPVLYIKFLSSRFFSVKKNVKISITIILKPSFLGREQHLP